MYPNYWQKFTDVASADEFHHSIVTASDGLPLHVFERGTACRPAVILITPPAASFLYMVRIARELSRSFHVIGWEARGGPFLQSDADGLSHDINRQALDLTQILGDKVSGRCHVISWCAGVHVLSRCVHDQTITPLSAVVIAPTNIGAVTKRNLFDSMYVPTVRSLLTSASPQRHLNLVVTVLLASRPRSADEAIVRRFVALNFSDLDVALRYAKLVDEYSVECASSTQPNSVPKLQFDEMCNRLPTLVIHALDDEVVGWKSSLDAVTRCGSAELLLCPAGGHPVPFSQGGVIAANALTHLSRNSSR